MPGAAAPNQPFDRRRHLGRQKQPAGLLVPWVMAISARRRQRAPGATCSTVAWLDTRPGAVSGGGCVRRCTTTLAELTAQSCANDLLHHGPQASTLPVCGGSGAMNGHLMGRLQTLPAAVLSSTERSLPPLPEVEATAFAWLARKTGAAGKLACKNWQGAGRP